ncbi:MAG: aldose 1-epimerase family protein [Planctomycetota bacterium]|nr:aldose 1-epimerase family protein [Planctomycetota bacterium]MDA1178191.1 aldose 1-epimerase family protein [Planctomycetota bacterium]
MPEETWKLIGSAAEAIHVPPWTTGSHQLGAIWNQGRSGLSAGVDTVTIWNDKLRVSVLPTRGMGLWRADCEGIPLGWQSPIRGPVHPQFVPLMEPSGLGWLDGFDEWLCRCGLISNGAPEFDTQGQLVYPLHGRIANRPAHDVTLGIDESAGTIRLTGIVEETRFHFHKLRMTSTITLQFGSTDIQLEDRIENVSDSPAEIQLLYHINYGPPLLGKGSQFVAPATRVVPRSQLAAQQVTSWGDYHGPAANTEETVFFTSLAADNDGYTQVMLIAPDRTRSAAIRYSTRQLPCFSLWKNETSLLDGYVTGLEPGTNYPNPIGFEKSRGRVVKLAPGANYDVHLQLSIDQTQDEVTRRVDAIHALNSNQTTIIEPRPAADWCLPD